MKNKYYNRSRISEAKFREAVKYFCLDVDATKTAEIVHLNRNTVNKIFDGIRQIIYLERMYCNCNNEYKNLCQILLKLIRKIFLTSQES